jgi:ribosomal protein L32
MKSIATDLTSKGKRGLKKAHTLNGVRQVNQLPDAVTCPCCGQGEILLPSAPPQWATLKGKLLSLGGTRVVWPGKESDLEELVTKGKVFSQPVCMQLGEPNRSHRNCALLWHEDMKNVAVATGYALNNVGLWRQHSWAVKNGRIIETTERMLKYFGILLNKGLIHFWISNYVLSSFPSSEPTCGADAKRS